MTPVFSRWSQLCADDGRPPFCKVCLCKIRQRRESLQACMREFQPRLITFPKQFKSYHRIASMPAISPGVRELRVHNHFRYFAEVAIFLAFFSGIKGELKPHFGLKLRKIEIALPLHSVFPGGIKELYHLFLRAFTI